MAETNQSIPLAPARDHQSNHNEVEVLKTKHTKIIKLCGCITATILLLSVVIIILSFTVFRVKDPKLTTNGITLTNLDLMLNNVPQVKLNMSLLIDLSIKNPNVAFFKLGNTTTTVYYRGVAVAEGRTLPGLVKARGTLRMNVTTDMVADRLVSSPDLVADVTKGEMNLSSYSVIPGRVNILSIVKKHVDVRMNCFVVVNISSRAIQDMNCHYKVKL
ncbi:hypothetical protein RIF29_15378 [Crotalaria pallida]|uniref:Late embryogenesis abundant protein LEA-2 subgroup domain-containing protein n=1 Tax=Crotalaria pallida TaxID=3830 RepID=A0AAN9FER8_CROPI